MIRLMNYIIKYIIYMDKNLDNNIYNGKSLITSIEFSSICDKYIFQCLKFNNYLIIVLKVKKEINIDQHLIIFKHTVKF